MKFEQFVGRVVCVFALAIGVPAGAQAHLASSPVADAASNTSWDYGALLQGGVGLQDRTDYSFLLVGGHAGKILTPEIGTGLFKGNVEYAVEVFPFWQSYTPKFQRLACPTGATVAAQCSNPYTVGGTYTGASITPIMVRWNFTHGRRFMPWVQAAGGVVWTNHKYPAVGNLNAGDPTQTGPQANTSVWNFTPQGGAGVHYFVKPRRSIDFSANAVHISSASLGDKNPGVNVSLQMSIGYSWWK
jgi:lipid A 3-O-deacylase